MFALKNFTRQWTTIYKPIAENGAEDPQKNFHCVESIVKAANLSKELPYLNSPFVAMENNIGGDITEKFLRPEYNIYFFVQAQQSRSPLDEEEDDRAKEEAMKHAMEYVNYLRHLQQQHEDDRAFPLMGINLDNVHFETFGPMYNRWFFVGLSLEDMSCVSKCYTPELYKNNNG